MLIRLKRLYVRQMNTPAHRKRGSLTPIASSKFFGLTPISPQTLTALVMACILTLPLLSPTKSYLLINSDNVKKLCSNFNILLQILWTTGTPGSALNLKNSWIHPCELRPLCNPGYASAHSYVPIWTIIRLDVLYVPPSPFCFVSNSRTVTRPSSLNAFYITSAVVWYAP